MFRLGSHTPGAGSAKSHRNHNSPLQMVVWRPQIDLLLPSWSGLVIERLQVYLYSENFLSPSFFLSLVQLTLGLPQNSEGESRLSLGSNEQSQELASEAPRCKAPVAAPHPQA